MTDPAPVTVKTEVLAEKAEQLANAKSRYEAVRQVLFYVMFVAIMLMLGVMGFVAFKVQGIVSDAAAQRRQSDIAREQGQKAIVTILDQIRKDGQTDTNAQTVAIEKFILEVQAGRTPTPGPVVFPTPRKTASPAPRTGTPSKSPQPAPSRRPGASPSTRPPVVVPSPQPTPRVTCLPRVTPVIPNSICI